MRQRVIEQRLEERRDAAPRPAAPEPGSDHPKPLMPSPSFVLLLGLILLGGCTITPRSRPAPPSIEASQRPAVLLHLGEDAARAGDPMTAVQLFRSASRAAPGDAAPLDRMGEALIDLNDPARAEQAFRGALAIDSDDDEASRGLAVSLIGEARPSEALDILRRLDDDTRDIRVLRAEGTALDMLGQRRSAQAAYRRGLAIAPTDPDLHGNLALSLALDGDVSEAVSELRAALASPTPDPRQDANAVLVLALIGRTQEARTRGLQTIGRDATDALLARAARATGSGPNGQAIELGVLTSSSPEAPPAPRADLAPVMPDVAPVAPNAPAAHLSAPTAITVQ